MSGSEEPRQLALNVRLRDEATFESFYATPATRQPWGWLQAATAAAGGLAFLHGPTDGGKTHLLQAACQRSAAAVYLPLKEVAARGPGILDGLEQLSLLCIDGLDEVLPSPHWEEALFHCVNRARDSGCVVAFAARQPPARLPLRLEDLRSRLAGGVTFALPAPDDETRIGLLELRARNLGLILQPGVAAYLVHRAPRGLATLLGILTRLDEASLASRRRVSLALVREVLSSVDAS